VTVAGRGVDVIADQTSAAFVAFARVVLADLAGRPALLRANALGPNY